MKVPPRKVSEAAIEKGIQRGPYRISTLVSDERWCENCYLVRHLPSSELVLIDPGGNPERLIQAVVDQGENLKKVLITHAHPDHVSAVAALQERFRVPCYLQKDDARLLRQAPLYAFVFAGEHIEPCTQICLYDRGDDLGTAHQRIKAVSTPGHTAGSMCYDFGDFVFTGDTLLYQHVGRIDTPGSSLGQLKASVSRLLDVFSDETLIFPGHGRTWTIGEARAWWGNAGVSPPQYRRFGEI